MKPKILKLTSILKETNLKFIKILTIFFFYGRVFKLDMVKIGTKFKIDNLKGLELKNDKPYILISFRCIL